MTTITGTVHFASKEAERNRYYREGQTISTSSYVKAVWLSATFVQLDFDTSGRSYVHVAVEGPAFDVPTSFPASVVTPAPTATHEHGTNLPAF